MRACGLQRRGLCRHPPLPTCCRPAGADAYRVLWGKLVSSAALVVCAALGDMRRQHAKLGFPPHATFEVRAPLRLCAHAAFSDCPAATCRRVASAPSSSLLSKQRATCQALRPCLAPAPLLQLLGLDYLVDTSMHPHLLEVNGTPSLAVAHAEPSVEQLIRDAKVGARVDACVIGHVRGGG